MTRAGAATSEVCAPPRHVERRRARADLRPLPWLFLILSSLAVVVAACAPPAPPDRAAESPPDTNRAGGPDRPYVVLVGVDGFRYDYLERHPSPNFARLVAAGARAAALIPPFPSLTFPSFYTIATGLYPGRHGIVANTFYDPDRHATFSIDDRPVVEDGTWYGGEPIWVTAERAGIASAAFFYPGTEADIGGVRPTFWRPYDAKVPYAARVDGVLDWLELPPETRPHLILTYFSAVDSAGHDAGPDSTPVGEAVELIDTMVGRLMDGISRLAHGDRVLLVVVSDHGMADLTASHAIDDAAQLRGVRALPIGPHLALFVSGEASRAGALRDAVNARVPQARAYLRAELPPELHTANNPRFGDVLLIAPEGAEIRVGPRRAAPPAGMHGWAPDDVTMHGIFLVTGPGIEPGSELPAFESVHIYPFLATVLGLQPSQPIDGDPAVLARLLTSVPSP